MGGETTAAEILRLVRNSNTPTDKPSQPDFLQRLKNDTKTGTPSQASARHDQSIFPTAGAENQHVKSSPVPVKRKKAAPSPTLSGAPVTPLKGPYDPNKYAGPTFHSSPAPTVLPVPTFLSQSVPSNISMDSFFSTAPESAASAVSAPASLGSASSANSTPAASPMHSPNLFELSLPAPRSPTKTSVVAPAVPTVSSTTVTIEKVMTDTTSSPPIKRGSRYGDSVVFKPRRKGKSPVVEKDELISGVEKIDLNSGAYPSLSDISARLTPQNRVQQDLRVQASRTGTPKPQRRAPNEFDFLFRQTPTRASPVSVSH